MFKLSMFKLSTFDMFTDRFTFQTTIVLAMFLTLVTTSSARPLADACHEATPIHLTDEQTLYGVGGSGLQYLNVTVPNTGILVIDVETDASNQTAARLALLGKGCADTDDATDDAVMGQNDFVIVEQSLSHQMIAFRSTGTWLISLAPAVPGATLGAYEVGLSFVAAQAKEEDIDLGRGQEASRLRARRIEFSVDTPESKSEQAAVDPDPDAPLTWAEEEQETILSLVTFYSAPVARSEQAAVDPDPDTPFTFGSGAGEKLAHMVLYPGGVLRQSRGSWNGTSVPGSGLISRGHNREPARAPSLDFCTGFCTEFLQRFAALLWHPSVTAPVQNILQ